MVNSYVYYTGDGSTNNFQITFDYLSKEFVQVYLDGVPLVVETDYIFTGDRTIIIPVIPASGSIVFIQRVTSKNRLVEFRDASILVANDLDISALQVIHIAEEANDNTQKAIQANTIGNFDTLGRRIVNVGDPVDPTDATNKLYVDTRFAADVSAAVAARDAAIIAKGLSEDARDAAQVLANAADASAQNSAASALLAAGSAEDAANDVTALLAGYVVDAQAAKTGAELAEDGAHAAQLAAEAISTEAAARAYNYIINGNFDIWQRGTSQTTNGYGSADRWLSGNTGTTKTASQQAFTLGQTDVPDNPKYYMRHVVTSVSGVNNYCILQQKIEYVKTLAGKTATLSFWAKADSSKNIAIEFMQSFGTGGTPSSVVGNIGSQLVALTTSWAKYTVTVDIPSIAGKTLGTDGNDFLSINFWFDAGSVYTTRAANLGQQSGTFDIANVSLVEGDVDVKPIPRSCGEELALCQRYYETGTTTDIYNGTAASTTLGVGTKFSVTKRAVPSVSLSSGTLENPQPGGFRMYLAIAAGAWLSYILYKADAEL